jgi:uncharacterized membrane protein
MNTAVKSVLAVLALALYCTIAHLITLSADGSALSYGFVFAFPAVVLVGLWLGQGPKLRWPLLAVAAILVAAWFWLDLPSLTPPQVLLLQHVGTHVALGLVFGLSALAGREALVTRMARLFHGGEVTEEMIVYSRQVNHVWTLYFALMAAVSLLLYLSGQAFWWSILSNFLTMPIVVSIFVIELAVRRKRLPNQRHASLKESIQAYTQVRQDADKR